MPTPPPTERSRPRAALVAVRAGLAALLAEAIERMPSLEPPFVRTCRWSARHSRVLFGLCWATNVRLNELLRLRGRRYRNVEIGPLCARVDVTDQSGYGLYFYGDPYEPLLTEQLFASLRAGDVFIDIGANVGLFTMIAAKIVGASGRVVAFEPHPEARAELLALLEQNGVSAIVEVVGAALSDREAANVALHVTERTSLSTLDLSVAPARDDFAYTGTVTVNVTTLDAWMAAHDDLVPRVALVKIDVEGLEDRVIAGMRETLPRVRRARIICETAGGSAADRALLAAGYDAVGLEMAQGTYVGNRLYTRPPK